MAARGRKGLSNGALAMLLVGVVAGFVGLAYASVPLYRLFCQVTGYGGTTQVARAAPATVGARKITVRFNADVNRDMPWSFVPAQREMVLTVGETGLAFYRATNRSPKTVTGTATFNVTPMKAGPYFDKIQCFCFNEQTLAAGQTVDMPVSFFVDPAIAQDPGMDDVSTITLSYTFFRAADDVAAATTGAAARAVPPAATN
jgi:cytochrome c oxidase assembly protein subunit 11